MNDYGTIQKNTITKRLSGILFASIMTLVLAPMVVAALWIYFIGFPLHCLHYIHPHVGQCFIQYVS